MPEPLPSCSPRLLHNPRADRERAYGPSERAILNRAAFEVVRAEISAWPGYAPTPLRSLKGLAGLAGVDRLWFKDESTRFNLGSVMALGGAYAVLRLLMRRVSACAPGVPVTTLDLVVGRYGRITRATTVVTDDAGNHGRAVAWGAQAFGCACVAYLPATVAPDHRRAVEAFGARVVAVDGDRDDAARRAAADAAARGWTVVSDGADGDMDVPRDVMQGYTVMVEEAMAQLPASERPTHVFVPGGNGALPAAVCGHLWESWGRGRPRLIVVEPAGNAGLMRTAEAGPAGREPSPFAWFLLESAADDFVAVADAATAATVRLLAEGCGGDRPLAAGRSGAAALAAVLCALQDPPARAALGLWGDARVLVFGAEGAADPQDYGRPVGGAAAVAG
ncbi:diaminopropionate ammonia-lyase [Azospirillum sp. A39]|uniref:diaminopropionate ammonia-lyase n=1 Tax=Azospirillum sp. A39 TaxID=3462279 RepID=UPI00404608E2